jgi:thioredoxin reductase
VVLVDAAARPGGQYWRHPGEGVAAVSDLHHDLATFRGLRAALPLATYLSDHQVWNVEADENGFVVRALHRGAAVELLASRLVLAPGGYDRQLPIPGWDLPGVLAAGGAQALLKGNQVVPGRRVVVAGTGPFLLPVAAGLLARGAEVAAALEANDPRGWLRQLPAVMRNAAKLREGAAYAATLARHRTPYRTGHAVLAVHGDRRVEAVTVARLDGEWQVLAGTERQVECDTVALGWGFTPLLELPLMLGCATAVDVDGSLVVTVGDGQESSVPGVYAAGEATGVGGAALAVVEGAIAGVVASGGRPNERLLHRRTALRGFAAAMHAAYPVRDGWRGWLADDTLLCRCEEVAAGTVLAAVRDLGARDARTAKLLTRAGMGWCQGRVCGFALARLVSGEAGTAYDPRGIAERMPAVPVPLDVLAEGAPSDDLPH